MEEKIIEIFFSKVIEETISEFKTLIGKAADETSLLFKIGIKDYIKKQIELIDRNKTLLHGATPVKFYDFYYPLRIKPKETITLTFDTSSIKNVFKRSNYITIIGDAGSGKSTLVKHLFICSIKENFQIPIIIELRYLNNEEDTIESYILKKLSIYDISPSNDLLERLLKKGKFVFFLDGFDELKSKLRPKVIHDLRLIIDKYDKNLFLITTRPYSNIDGFNLFANYGMVPYNKDEIIGFIKKQLCHEKEFSDKIVKSVSFNKSKYIEEFLTNPLLLSLYILTFQRNPDIPENRHIFYRRVIQALYSEHDSLTKLGYVRERLVNLSQDEFEIIFKRFSFLSFFENRFYFDYDFISKILTLIKAKIPEINFAINDFVEDLKQFSFWVEDQGVYSFNHRSIQEYLAASFIQDINIENKEKVYTRIFKLIEDEDVNEISHFLTLLSGIDEIHYLEYFTIPLLSYFADAISTTSDSIIISSSLLFFKKSITCNDNYEYSAYSSHPFIKYISIIDEQLIVEIHNLIDKDLLKLTRKGLLQDMWRIRTSFAESTGEYVTKYLYINFEDEIPSVVLSQLTENKKLIAKLKEFITTILVQRQTVRKFLVKKKNVDSEFIDFI